MEATFIRFMLEEHRNCNIINVDALRYGSNADNLCDIKDTDRYAYLQGDIADEAFICSLIGDVDGVVSFAAETHVDRSISSPDSFLHSNVLGVYSLLEALRNHNPTARFVQISTDEVYGDALKGSFTEESAL